MLHTKPSRRKKMKTSTAVFLSIASLMISISAKAAPAPASKEVTVALNDIFVPGGFDSASESYVVVNGIFPNGCYKWKGATRTDVTDLEHEITPVATVSSGMCIQVLVPFMKDIRLGRLSVGSHVLRFLSNDGTFIEKNLTIEQ
jgi:hypothetical protein